MNDTTAVEKIQDKSIDLNKTTNLVTKEKVREYLNVFGFTNLTKQETSQFIEIATAYNLNPFKKEIYCIPYGQGQNRKLSILTGYEVYLKRAERINKLSGWSVKTEGSIRSGNLKAVITINRKDWSNPFIHEVYFTEYNQNNHIWKTKPITMIKKVAIAQGFRMAFPDDMGGMPYTSDEIPEEMTEIKDVTPKPIENIPNKTNSNPLQAKYAEFQKTFMSINDIASDEDKERYNQTVTAYQNKQADIKSLQHGINYIKKAYSQFFQKEAVA